MTVVQFLTASGVLAWGFILWRTFQLVRGFRHRLAWALWGRRAFHRSNRIR